MESEKSIPSRGSSASWRAQKGRALHYVNRFIMESDVFKKLIADDNEYTWDTLPVTMKRNRDFYQHLAYYFCELRAKTGRTKGTYLRDTTVVQFLRMTISLAQQESENDKITEEAKYFFECLQKNNVNNRHWRWLKGVSSNMKRYIMQRSKRTGEYADQLSAKPLYLAHVIECVKVYLRNGSAEGVQRIFALISHWQSGNKNKNNLNVIIPTFIYLFLLLYILSYK